VALLMALDPQVYMFDEPTAGMSHDEAPVILDLIRALKKDKTKTILLVEHKMDVVRELADRIIVLHNGALVADGEPAEVIASPVCRRRTVSPRRPAPHHGDAYHIGAYHILHGVDLVVPRGQLTMLLGRNGVGKTTTLRTIMGLWPASKGASGSTARTSPAVHAADRLPEHRLRAREHGHLCRPDGEGKHAAGRAHSQAGRADG
jgi:ABC-type branched-subunit amino acid transport system ATPase component